jgi:MerR family transcriptional regulator, light-induced transcriptional regulator
MRTLTIGEAAAMLNVSPSTLRSWERRFGFPRPLRSPGRHRRYLQGEVATLRTALTAGATISSAVSAATRAIDADEQALVAALTTFGPERADRAMEAALAMRSLDRALEDVLLPSLDNIRERAGGWSATWAFAARWAADWLRRAQRLSVADPTHGTVLVGHAADTALDPVAPYAGALELCCARAGAGVLAVSVRASRGLAELVQARPPGVVVIAGCDLADATVARWAHAVRSATGAVPVLRYRCVMGQRRIGSGPHVLPESPLHAAERILRLLGSRPAARAA